MPMYFFQTKVRPKDTHPKIGEYWGAMVNCWIQRESQPEAEAVARDWIDAEHWHLTEFEEAMVITRETQQPGGMQYFEQAEIDGQVLVFYACSVGPDDDPED
ncbi:hypothetical protein AYO49_05020 [Verrucomicrobiaceae bacterium SCGC AG-212-N21]|nr:hypothetical protein AYO49_05020 [Verrucomicrobiaceae bacterium SCGC AG-212-N21]